jgi:hypothetical protein
MSFRTPNLLDVPKTHPSRSEKIHAFKTAYQIETHDNGDATDPGRWLAGCLAYARKLGYGVTRHSNLFDCIQKVGRLMDDAGYCAHGKTEIEAIRRVCENLKIPCEL